MQRTRTYECMCLLDNREVRNGWQPLKDVVTGVFTKHGGKILSSRRWDERRIAYAINGQTRGTFLLVYFAADTNAVAGIRRDLQFNESVLRSLVLDCQEVPQEAYEPEAEFDVNAIPADDAEDPIEEPAEEPRAPRGKAEDAAGDTAEEPAGDADGKAEGDEGNDEAETASKGAEDN